MKGAIFDVDGTLLDSMNVWWKVTSDFFRNNTLYNFAVGFACTHSCGLERAFNP